MKGIYPQTGVCLLLVCRMVCGGQGSWEDLVRRSEELFGEGKLVEAETILMSAVKAAEVFGPADRRLAETQHSLPGVCRDLGKLPEAEKWYQRSLSNWKASSGKDDPKLPKPLISLASLYLENGLSSKAQRLVDPWLRDPAFKLDIAHPLSINLLQNVANLKHAQRKYSEAEMLYRQVLSATETSFPPNSLQMSVLNNLGILLAQTGRNKEAGSHLERALALQERAVPRNNIDLARSLNNLAAFYRSTRDYTKAEPLFQRRAQTIRQGHSGQDLGRHTVDFRDLITSGDAGRVDKR